MKKNEIIDTASSEDAAMTSKQFSEIAKTIRRRGSTVVVVTGAGISVNAGIPDFRSTDNGLYKLVEEKFPGILKKGQNLFDASMLSASSSKSDEISRSFFSFLGLLKRMSESAAPTVTHSFFSFLLSSQKLLRIYTQNIDGLEKRFQHPLIDEKVVQLHGTLDILCCTACPYSQRFTDFKKYENDGIPSQCPSCIERVAVRVASGKRALPIGLLTPPILLYNHSVSSKLTIPDLETRQGDNVASVLLSDELLLKKRKNIVFFIVGTSCKVVGIRKLIKRLSTLSTMTVFVNKTPLVQKEWNSVFSCQLIGDCDVIFGRIWKLIEGTRTINSFFPQSLGSISDNHVKLPVYNNKPLELKKADSNLSRDKGQNGNKDHIEKNRESSPSFAKTGSLPKSPTKNLDDYFGKVSAKHVRRFSELPTTPPTVKTSNRLSLSPMPNPALPFKCTKHNPSAVKT